MASKALSFEGFHSEEEIRVLRSIVAREDAIDRLLEWCCQLDDPDPELEVDGLAAILQVRQLSLQVVDAIASWRRRMVTPQPFLWRGSNYLVRMTCDLDFVSRSQRAIAALDGVRLGKRNPFATIGGLDASMRLFWQLELPNEDDLPVLLDSTAMAPGTQIDEPSRVRLSEWCLLLEERRYGSFSRADALADVRLKTLIQCEAEFATKRRVGGAQPRQQTQ
ncbi:hypothetical protein P43SY_007723 [Pythium insidiosum]|uniref:Uncharacterized protein n=1 Tax=Pythium insidiosum TaxID=114742 RepID=A0AAD5Q8P3_PYTIN|nr:hypothetical protein P43SY_007723 [Pythium insidiosum]